MTRIVSFDIEEWYIEKALHGGRKEKYKLFDTYFSQILDTLDEVNMKATFFCLGKIATDFPYVVKCIAERGHEIGCHSNEHLWINKMTPAQFQNDTHDAIAALEDVCGTKVRSYRAPAFSIGENNKWAFEILAENGIDRDASVFPAKRDFGGFASFPTASPVWIEYNGVKIKEFPICVADVLRHKMAYCGGGYFRFFPYPYIKKQMDKSNYSISYFHIGDLLHNKARMMTKEEYETYFKEPGTLKNRVVRYVKSTLGTKGAFEKMCHLLNAYPMTSLQQADEMIDWEDTPVVMVDNL